MSMRFAPEPVRRNLRIWRLPLVLVVGMALLTGSAFAVRPTASADSITNAIGNAQQQLKNDAAAAAEIKAQIANDQTQAAQLAADITTLTNQMAATAKQIVAANTRLEQIQGSMMQAEQNLAWTQTQLASDKSQLSGALVVLYMTQQDSTPISNFLNSGDFNSLWQHVVDMQRLTTGEQQLVASVVSEEATITADVASISQQKRDQSTLIATLKALNAQQATALLTRQAAETALGVKLVQENQTLALNEQSQKDVQNQIAQLKAEEAAALAAGGGHGQFGWPLTGPITQGFGCTPYTFEMYDPQCPSLHFHTGIDIAAACGTPVHAADAGIAHTYVSSYGYGLHVLIDHGNGWVTLYGHLEGFNVSNGQTVRRGQVIGYEGSTGNSTGCHVHFEIDLNGNPQNPMHYLS